MKITIIGAGKVGQALGPGWRKAGHDVTYAVRPGGGKNADTVAADGFAVVALDQAAHADLIVLAVPWTAVADALQATGSLAGKILVDVTNPITYDDGQFGLALGLNDSGGEAVARLAPGAKVVKAFNYTAAENMGLADGFPAKPMMPVAGDDDDAKATVMALAETLGFEAIDAGPLKSARLLEPLALLWVEQAYLRNFGRNFAFAIVRR